MTFQNKVFKVFKVRWSECIPKARRGSERSQLSVQYLRSAKAGSPAEGQGASRAGVATFPASACCAARVHPQCAAADCGLGLPASRQVPRAGRTGQRPRALRNCHGYHPPHCGISPTTAATPTGASPSAKQAALKAGGSRA